MVNILYSWQAFLRDVLQGGNGGGDPDPPPIPPLTRNSKFFGGEHFPPFLHSFTISAFVHYPEKTYFQPFSKMILICVLCILFQWNLNSRDAFSYVVSTIFGCRVWDHCLA